MIPNIMSNALFLISDHYFQVSGFSASRQNLKKKKKPTMGLYIAPGSYQRSLENCNFLNQVEKKYVSRNNMVMVNYKTYTAIKKVSFRVLETRAYI